MPVQDKLFAVADRTMLKLSSYDTSTPEKLTIARRAIKDIVKNLIFAVNPIQLNPTTIKNATGGSVESTQGEMRSSGVVFAYANYDGSGNTYQIKSGQPVSHDCVSGYAVTGVNPAWGQDEYEVVGIAMQDYDQPTGLIKIPIMLGRSVDPLQKFSTLGKTISNFSRNSSGTVAIYTGTPGSETTKVTGDNVTAFAKFFPVAGNTFVWLDWNGKDWYIVEKVGIGYGTANITSTQHLTFSPSGTRILFDGGFGDDEFVSYDTSTHTLKILKIGRYFVSIYASVRPDPSVTAGSPCLPNYVPIDPNSFINYAWPPINAASYPDVDAGFIGLINSQMGTLCDDIKTRQRAILAAQNTTIAALTTYAQNYTPVGLDFVLSANQVFGQCTVFQNIQGSSCSNSNINSSVSASKIIEPSVLPLQINVIGSLPINCLVDAAGLSIIKVD